jgi:predicted component of type VI protein secretion system
LSKLVLHVEDGTTLDIPLDQERITIGRRADNDVCLSNLAVSGEHAAVVTILDDSFLEDLGSTNGTLVNGNAIVKHFLRDKDEIDVGRHKFVYCVDENTVVNSQYESRGMRSAAGDLGEQVSIIKPGARSRRGAASGRSQASSTSKGASGSGTGKVRGAKSVPVSDPPKVDLRHEAVSPAPAPPRPAPLPSPPPPPPLPPPKPSVKVLAGPQAGRDLPLTQGETTIGRAGVQVALISQTGDTFRLQPIEGDRAPLVNGQPASKAGVALSPGDVIEIAGSRLEFVYRA